MVVVNISKLSSYARKNVKGESITQSKLTYRSGEEPTLERRTKPSRHKSSKGSMGVRPKQPVATKSTNVTRGGTEVTGGEQTKGSMGVTLPQPIATKTKRDGVVVNYDSLSIHAKRNLDNVRREPEAKTSKIDTGFMVISKTPGVVEAIMDREREPLPVSEGFYSKYERQKGSIVAGMEIEAMQAISNAGIKTAISGFTIGTEFFGKKVGTDLIAVGATGLISAGIGAVATPLLSPLATKFPVATATISSLAIGAYGSERIYKIATADTNYQQIVELSKTGAGIIGGMIGYEVGKGLAQTTIKTKLSGFKTQMTQHGNKQVKQLNVEGKVKLEYNYKWRDLLGLKPKSTETYSFIGQGRAATLKDIGIAEYKGFLTKGNQKIPVEIKGLSIPKETYIQEVGGALVGKDYYSARGMTTQFGDKKILFTDYGVKKGLWKTGKPLSVGKELTTFKTKVSPGEWKLTEFKTLGAAQPKQAFDIRIQQKTTILGKTDIPFMSSGVKSVVVELPSTPVTLKPQAFLSGIGVGLAQPQTPLTRVIPPITLPGGKMKSLSIQRETPDIVSMPKMSVISEPSPATLPPSSVTTQTTISRVIGGGISITPSITTLPPTTPTTPITGITPPPVIPKLPFLFGGGLFGKGKLGLFGKRPLKYQPSLVAKVFGITGKKPKFLTGLEVRPIV